MEKIKIIIIEDHSILRETLSVILKKENMFKVLGHWDNAEDALEFAKKNAVDIAIADNMLPAMDGITFTKKLKEVSPKTNVIMLSMVTDEEKIFEALSAGAKAYIPKIVSIDELISALKCVHNGEIFIHPELLKKFIGHALKLNNSPDKKQILSKDQINMLQLAADGDTNKEIAARTQVPLSTVKLRFHEIFKALNAKHRTHAIVIASKLKLISLDKFSSSRKQQKKQEALQGKAVSSVKE